MDYDPGSLPCPTYTHMYETLPRWCLLLMFTVVMAIVVWRLIDRGATLRRFGLALITMAAGSVTIALPSYVLERLEMQSSLEGHGMTTVLAVYGGAVALLGFGFLCYMVLDRFCEYADASGAPETPAAGSPPDAGQSPQAP